MSRLYLSFKTDLPDSDPHLPTPQVDAISFDSGNGSFTLSCNGFSEFGVEHGEYNLCYKGVEICFSDVDEDYRGLELSDLPIIACSEIADVVVYDSTDTLHSMTVSNLSMKIQVNDTDIQLFQNKCNAYFAD